MDETLNNNVNPSNPNLNSSPDPNQVAKDIQNFDSQSVPEDLDVQWTRWKCLVCGYVYEGAGAPKVCPKCGNEDPDKFDDAE